MSGFGGNNNCFVLGHLYLSRFASLGGQGTPGSHRTYTKAIAEHHKLTIDELQIAILTTEILGEKTDNQDGTVRYIFVNKHNVKTYPVLDTLFHGNKVGIMSAPQRAT